MNVLVVDEYHSFKNIYKSHSKLNFTTFSKLDIREVIKELCNNNYKCAFITIPKEELHFATYIELIKIVGRTIDVYVIESNISTGLQEKLFEIEVEDILSFTSNIIFEHKVNKILNSIIVDSGNRIYDSKNRVEVDLITRTVYYKNQIVEFSNKEYMLLVYFLNNMDKIITRTKLEVDVWGSTIDGLESRTIDIYIMKIRKALNPYCIDTVRGKGYIWRSK